jgi:uncharacterized radical SAM protein YgiQ
MRQRGWDVLDVLLITGDPHLDHPAFPGSLIGRWLEFLGYRVAMVSRPDPRNPEALMAFGVPRLFVGVTAGALDSMVANYTATGRKRSDDPYSPLGKGPGRPDRALTVYGNLARRAFGKSAIIVAGGLEASLRRFAHYDFWSGKVRRPILMDCGADVLIHGMGEGPIRELAARLNALLSTNSDATREQKLAAICDVRGLGYRQAASVKLPTDAVELPDSDKVAVDPVAHAEGWRIIERNREAVLTQVAGGMRVIVNPPWPPLSTEELDCIYALPFTRNAHPMYEGAPFPALEQVRFSIVSHRGCFGGCAFCAISAHQGKHLGSRSEDSILDEAARIAAHPDFRGTIPDVGGPTANMYGLGCTKPEPCDRPSCLAPRVCEHLNRNQERYRKLLQAVSKTSKVVHVFVTSGLRHDLLVESPELFDRITRHHTSGHLKVAPEHTVPSVLRCMRKPAGNEFERLVSQHDRVAKGLNKGQRVVPYLMAAHPGSRMEDMVELALWLKQHGLIVEQCQIFTPTPGTAATVMYATGINPDTMQPVFVERDTEKKNMQKALILYHLPENRTLVQRVLALCGMESQAGDLLNTPEYQVAGRAVGLASASRTIIRPYSSGRPDADRRKPRTASKARKTGRPK